MTTRSCPPPATRWWQGRVECSICGYGAPGHDVERAALVVAIDAAHDHPVQALECPDCGNFALHPADPEAPR